jgi:hypothetical protein
MRRFRLRLGIKQMMVLVAVLGVATWGLARYQRDWINYARGWLEAEGELWQGNATVYDFGGFCGCGVDRDTGLPIHWVSARVRSVADHERVRGHNDHLAQYIGWHGLPKNSLKPWEGDLFDLKRFVNDHSRTEPPRSLLAGGPALRSPDGKYSVRPVAGVGDDGTPDGTLKIVIAAGNVVIAEPYVRFLRGESELIWGPDGSRLVVVRSTVVDREEYTANDLSTGRWLREETWRGGRPCHERPD